MKRFAYSEARIDKLGSTVLYPMYGLNIDHLVASETTYNAVYDLVGVCNHYGTLMEGHCKSFCFNPVTFSQSAISGIVRDFVSSKMSVINGKSVKRSLSTVYSVLYIL